MTFVFNYCPANYDIILQSSNVLIVHRSLYIFLLIKLSGLIITLSLNIYDLVGINFSMTWFCHLKSREGLTMAVLFACIFEKISKRATILHSSKF